MTCCDHEINKKAFFDVRLKVKVFVALSSCTIN